jgi:hypothetical protein
MDLKSNFYQTEACVYSVTSVYLTMATLVCNELSFELIKHFSGETEENYD